ncbi:diacylglycerol/lipid kinase family protein [Paenibacillaceae bacterium WGS1546]|uniref:diacylglycerol/lipid kinase family protein n=1 Tax=Cohnella sp. WGS1546 TaxID=3366810 RepID=UPI00372CEAC1
MFYFIVNRLSGNGHGLKAWKRIQPLLREKEIDYRVEFPESPDQAAYLLRKFVKETERVDVVAVVGGDGTVQSVAGELAGSGIPLGVIPAGSGNDLARALGIPLIPVKALDHMLTGTIKKMDMAQSGNKACVTVVGIGIDGQIAQTVNHSRYKKWFNALSLGRLTYVLSLLQVLFRYRPLTVNIKVDETEMSFSDVWLIAVANIPNYGGGMHICPDASYTDGVFDICIVHGISRFGVIRIFPRVIAGKHIYRPGISMLRGQEIKIFSSNPMLAHGDGEVIGETPIDISIRREAIHVICQEKSRDPSREFRELSRQQRQ